MSTIHDNVPSKKINNRPATKEELNEYLEANIRQRGVRFYKSRRDHLRHLEGNADAVLVMAYIRNLLFLKGRTAQGRKLLRKKGLWFKCPMNRITEYTYMKEDKVRRCVRLLEAYEMMWTERRHNNATWVKINCDKLDEIEQKWIAIEAGTYKQNQIPRNAGSRTGETPDLELGKRRISINKKTNKKTIEENPSPRFSIPHDGFKFGQNDTVTKKKSDPVIDQKYINAHKRLREILHSAEPTRYVSPMGKKAGAEQIRLLCEINLQGDFEIIEDVLEDYADCINDIPKPSIINAKQFREQFSWLQSEIGKLKGYVNGRPYNGI